MVLYAMATVGQAYTTKHFFIMGVLSLPDFWPLNINTLPCSSKLLLLANSSGNTTQSVDP